MDTPQTNPNPQPQYPNDPPAAPSASSLFDAPAPPSPATPTATETVPQPQPAQPAAPVENTPPRQPLSPSQQAPQGAATAAPQQRAAFSGQPPLQDFRTPVPVASSRVQPAPPEKPVARHGKRRRAGSVWITTLKVFSWVLFVLIIFAGAGYGVFQAYQQYAVLSSLEAVLTIGGYSLGAVLVAFLMISSVMVRLNMALDVSAIRLEIEEQTRY